MVAILWYAVPRLKTDGMAILLYLGLYSFGRFFISFYRVNNILLLGLREAQIVALVVLVAVGAGGAAVAQSGAARRRGFDAPLPATVACHQCHPASCLGLTHGDDACVAHGAGVIAGGSQPLPSRMPAILAGLGPSSRQITSNPWPLAVGSQLAT